MTLGIGALCILAAALSWAGAAMMCRLSAHLGFTDAPNERSSHSTPTPRAGGIGFALAVPLLTAAGLVAMNGGVALPEAALLTASLGLAAIGLADDRWSLRPSVRLVAQVAAAGAVTATGGVLHDVDVPGLGVLSLGVAAIPITLLWIVGVTNIYNFMDGIDGIAAVQAILAAAAIGSAALVAGSRELALAMGVLAAGAAGFLLLNWAPARVFMGDVGSTFLGFTLAAWAATPPRAVPIIVWVAALSPFLFDSTVTFVRRLLRGERVYEAHRSHFYQRLVQLGWPHARTTILYGGLAALSGTLAAAASASGMTAPATAALAWSALAVPLSIPVVVSWTQK